MNNIATPCFLHVRWLCDPLPPDIAQAEREQQDTEHNQHSEVQRQRNARYIVGTPKGRLRSLERELHDQKDWHEVDAGVEVKLIDHPDGQGQESYVLCRSAARHEKEAAMLRRQCERLRAKLMEIDASLKKRAQNLEATGRRIGKWMGRNTAAEKVFRVEAIREEDMAVGLRI